MFTFLLVSACAFLHETLFLFDFHIERERETLTKHEKGRDGYVMLERAGEANESEAIREKGENTERKNGKQ